MLGTGLSAGALALAAWKSPELLKEIYGDLAKPGVAQVGKALETIAATGCLALLPLRLLNERARHWEQKNFNDFAKKLANENIDDIIPVRPEIGVPILDRLSLTVDEDLRSLFLNLLTSASLESKSANCHPSFAHVISLLSPDEARLLKAWNSKYQIPYLSIFEAADGGRRELQTFILDIPADISFPNQIEIYINNMSGLGILEYSTEKWLSDDGSYLEGISHIKKTYPEIKMSQIQSSSLGLDYPKNYIYYEKGVIDIIPYGRLLQASCIS